MQPLNEVIKSLNVPVQVAEDIAHVFSQSLHWDFAENKQRAQWNETQTAPSAAVLLDTLKALSSKYPVEKTSAVAVARKVKQANMFVC